MLVRNLVVGMFIAATSIGAQENHATSKGSAIVGGTASLSRTTREGSDGVSGVLVAPNVLFLVADKVAFGGLLALSSSSSGGNSFTQFGIGPAARFFFADPGAKGQPYLEARALYNSASGSGGGSTASGTTLGASAGILQMVTKQVGISGELFWDRTSGDFVSNRATNNFGLRFGFSAFLIKGQ